MEARNAAGPASHYVPVLKGKAGEYRALATLPDAIAEQLTPVIEVIEPDGRPPTAWATEQARLLHRARGRHPVIVDLVTEAHLPPAAVDAYMTEARLIGLEQRPLTTLAAPSGYAACVQRAVGADGRGMALRVSPDDVVTGRITARSAAYLAPYGVAPGDVDLILDVGEILSGQVAQARLAADALIAASAPLTRWRTLTLVSAAFPVNLGGMRADAITPVARSDWELWLGVRSSGPARTPDFGDYGIAHPVLMTGFDPVTMQMSGSIRYTSDRQWLVSKGRSTRRVGWGQMRSVAGRIRARPEFSGSAFSWGDQFIDDCAGGRGTTGNATTWRKVGTSHHLTFVTRQLASLGAP